MRNRGYLITPKQLSMFTTIPEDTIRDMCSRKEILSIKFGKFVLIPTIQFRLKYPELPIEFWEEIVEDYYRELDGVSSSEMRLQRRREGRDPSTGRKRDDTKCQSEKARLLVNV